MTNRVRRVEELIQHELADILTRDFEFGGAIVTIHEVDMTPDLKQAHVYLGVIGREDLQSEALHKLRKAAGAISAKLSRRVVMKNSPSLHFALDDSIERGVRVLNIIEEIDELTPPDQPPYPGAPDARRPDPGKAGPAGPRG
jgi:ribosome-binding factor A